MQNDWDMIESLKHENGELKARQKRLYRFLDEIADDIQWEHGFDSAPYIKIREFLKAEGFN